MVHFTKRYHPPGTSPGTIVRSEAEGSVPLSISLIDYTAEACEEVQLDSAPECIPFLERSSVTWVHVQGDPTPETMDAFGRVFGFHPLAMEDVTNTGQRPKIDDFDKQLFVVMAHPSLGPDNKSVRIQQLSLFLGDNYVVSFHHGSDDPFEPVRKRLRSHIGRLRQRGSDSLLQALIDLVIDSGFPVLEWVSDELADLEEEMLETPTSEHLKRLYELKRTLVFLRRMLWPEREVVNRLVRGEVPRISESTRIYFSDCYDHTIQVMDLIESYRDMATGLLDVYLSSVSYRMNEVMRVLTVIATIFIPLTFIVGVYGMNFGNDKDPWAMPELRWYYGYPLVWLVMIVIAVGMLAFFRRRKWF